MKELFIKIGAYLLLCLGLMTALVLFIFSIFLFFSYPETSLEKRAIICLFFLIMAAIFAVFAVAVSESMLEIVHIEEEFEEIKAETKKK